MQFRDYQYQHCTTGDYNDEDVKLELVSGLSIDDLTQFGSCCQTSTFQFQVCWEPVLPRAQLATKPHTSATAETQVPTNIAIFKHDLDDKGRLRWPRVRPIPSLLANGKIHPGGRKTEKRSSGKQITRMPDAPSRLQRLLVVDGLTLAHMQR